MRREDRPQRGDGHVLCFDCGDGHATLSELIEWDTDKVLIFCMYSKFYLSKSDFKYKWSGPGG